MKNLSWHDREFSAIFAARGTLPHALLLHGQRGIGKLAFARALSQALLCENPAPDGACGRCTACAWFEAGGHPDYQQVEPAAAGAEGDEEAAEEGERAAPKKKSTAITVHQVRALADFINISSHRGGPKVVVVQPAEALNINAANALLKSLEEPPPGTHFLLVSHRPHQLLPTIRSRCQQIALHAPDGKTATAWLAAEGVRDPGLALAHMGHAPLLALELNGAEYWGARAAFMRQITAREIDVLAAADAIGDCPIPDVIAWLQKWTYDLVHFRATGRVRYNPDQQDAIARIAAQADALAMLRFHREMVQLQLVAQHPLQPRLFAEQLLLDYRDAVEAQVSPA